MAEDKPIEHTSSNSNSSNPMSEENILTETEQDLFDDRAPVQRELKRAKSMSCLSSNMLLFSDTFLSNTLSTLRDSAPMPKPSLRCSGPFKRPIPPKRRVSFFIPSESVSELQDNSSAFEFIQPRNAFQGDIFCSNVNFNFKGVESMLLQRSQSFCDPRSRDGPESWRDLL
jgi:hypothetical protein